MTLLLTHPSHICLSHICCFHCPQDGSNTRRCYDLVLVPEFYGDYESQSTTHTTWRYWRQNTCSCFRMQRFLLCADFSQVSLLCFSIKPCKNAVAKIELRSTHANAITCFAGGSNSESRWESELQRVHHLQPCVAVTRTLLAASSCQPQREEGDTDTHHQQEVAHLNISVFGDADHFRFYYISDLSKVQSPASPPLKSVCCKTILNSCPCRKPKRKMVLKGFWLNVQTWIQMRNEKRFRHLLSLTVSCQRWFLEADATLLLLSSVKL